MLKSFLILLINFYQKFLSFDSGVLQILAPGGACRYPIHCSEYTKQMVAKLGVFDGLRFGLKRIISCR